MESIEADSKLNKTAIVGCIRRLECLKNEHNIMLRKLMVSNSQSKIENQVDSQKLRILQDSLVNIEKSLHDAKSILDFYSCLKGCEIYQKKMAIEIQILNLENNEQKNQIKNLITLLNDKDRSIAELETKIEHISFLEKFQSLNFSNNSTCFDISTNSSRILNNTLNECTEHQSEFEEGKSPNKIKFETEIPSRLKTLHGLVVQYVSQGKHDLALPLCRQVIENLESKRGHYDGDVAVMLYTIALVYRDKKDYKEAIKYLKDSLHIRETIFGLDDLTVASTLNNLSVLYGKLKQFDEAERMCFRALKIRESVLGSTHADVAKQLTNLALIYQYQQKYDEVTLARTIYDNKLGQNDPHYIKTQSNLGLLYVKQARYSEAMHVYEQVLFLCNKILIELNDSFNGQENEYDRKDYNMPYDQLGHWHKASRVDRFVLHYNRPTLNSIFKYLYITYSKLNEFKKIEVLKSMKRLSQPSDKFDKIKDLIKLIQESNK